MSEPTKKLLLAEFNADLDFRENIKALKLAVRHKIDRQHVTLLPSGHLLGGVQVAVQLSNGRRLGYSGDFQWPLEKVIQVDALVVDSTYGSSRSRREYTQAERKLDLWSW